MLYLHSYEGPVAADAAFLLGLAGDRRVLAPTHPGFDGTEATPDLASLHNVVILYLELLDGLGLERVDVMGHSLGAMFAAELAAIALSRVGRLVLVPPLGLWSDEHPTPDVLSSGGPALLRMTWADRPAEAAAHAGNPCRSRAPPMWRWQPTISGHCLDRGLESRIHRLTMPTLLVRGDRDGVVSDGLVDEFARRFRAMVATVEGAGHFQSRATAALPRGCAAVPRRLSLEVADERGEGIIVGLGQDRLVQGEMVDHATVA